MAAHHVTKPKHHLILWATFFLLLIFIVWASFFHIDEIVFAEGKVIPFSKIQLIQSLDGGIVKKIYVQEGQIVQKDQELIMIEDTQFKSSFKEQETRALYLRAKIERLEAEMNNKPFQPSGELTKLIPEQMQTEKAQFEARKNELANMRSQRKSLGEELEMNRSLIAKGAVSKAEVLRIEQGVDELESRIHRFQSEAIDELNKAKSDLATIREQLVGLKFRLTNTTIKSPVKGIIKNLYVNTVGGVVKPGGEIMDIVPLGDNLLIEAKVKPNDVGFLHPGLKAIVKITAYDYFIYGGLDGKLETISADSTTTEKGEVYYKVYVRTDKNYLGPPNKQLLIIPGMVATVDIISGKKTIMNYLLKPILRLQAKALHEK